MLVGGLNEHQTILKGGPNAVAAAVSNAIAQTEGKRLMVGPGCALPLATPENVVMRPLKEKIMVVTAAAVWNTNRHHPMVGEVLGMLQK
jgi:hypothetical protein